MKLDKRARAAGPVVTGFAGTGFKIDGAPTSGGVLLTPEWWRPWGGALDPVELEPALAITPEFLILGTGATLVRPPRDLAATLDARGIGIEPMDSRAAARAWAVLRAEGRWIAAALMTIT